MKNASLAAPVSGSPEKLEMESLRYSRSNSSPSPELKICRKISFCVSVSSVRSGVLEIEVELNGHEESVHSP